MLIKRGDKEEKWSRLFAYKRFHRPDGIIKLTTEEQQEILDDFKKVETKNESSKNPSDK